MSTPLLTICPLPYATCTAPRVGPAKPALRATLEKPPLLARLAKLAIALGVLYVMFSGERWVLEHSAAGANELIVATCAADAVFGNSGDANACTRAGASNGAGSSSE